MDPPAMLRLLTGFLCLFLLLGCAEPVPGDGKARILMVGDSMFATGKTTGRGVGDVIQAALGLPVIDRSIAGSRYFNGLPLTAQFRPGDWDVIVVNGGGNDLLFGCGCGQCDDVLDRLIRADGRAGAIPSFVFEMRKTGAQIVYAGYMRNPGTSTPIKACGPAGNELDRRMAELAKLEPALTFIPMSDLVPYGDLSYHGIDRIHPSRKGSREIGLRLARVIGPMVGKMPAKPADAGN
jgi:acyl-CoA thioesterase I